MMGITPKAFAEMARGLPREPIAIGANCGTGPSELVCNVLALARCRDDIAVVAKANCGIPRLLDDGSIAYSGTPRLMADYARLARDAGATIIGGCCGTSPEHLAVMRQALDAHTPGEAPSVEVIERLLGQVSNFARQSA